MSAGSWQFRVVGVDQMTGELRDAVSQGQYNGMEKILLRGQALVVANTPVATGILANSISEDLQGGGALLRGLIFAGPPADVYAAPVETGAKPHFPPPSALLLWVKKRFGVESEKEALSIAFAVARNIAKRGTTGAHMFQKAFDLLQQEAPGILEVEVAAAVRAAGFGGQG